MPTRRPFFLLKAIDNALEILTKLNIIQTTHYHERTTSPNLDNPSNYQKKHLYFFSLQIPLTFHNKYLELISTHFYQALNNTWAVLFLSKFFTRRFTILLMPLTILIVLLYSLSFIFSLY